MSINITLSSGTKFSCPVDGWLDSGSGAMGPPTRTVDCHKSGKNIIRQGATIC